MTIHCCRDLDFGTGSPGNATGSLHTMHALSVFMQGVLGYTFHSRAGNFSVAGDSGFPGHPCTGPITGSDWTFNYYSLSGSTYTVISQSTMPYRSASVLIGMGPGRENWIQFSHDVVDMSASAFPVNYSGSFPYPATLPPPGDIFSGNPFLGRDMWLVLKSDEYPLANSGIYRIISQSIDDNAVIIDYRSTSNPFPQTSSYVTASLWFAPINGLAYNGKGDGLVGYAGNGQSGYQGNGASTFPRIILNSPSPNGWQVRLCIESLNDRAEDSTGSPALTAMPGYSGSNGDYPTGSFMTKSQHLHFGQWRNIQVGTATNGISQTAWNGATPGFDRFRWGTSPFRFRLFMWGDDQTGSVYACIRSNINVNGNESFIAFGEAEDPEPVPHPVNRLFVIGPTWFQSGIDWRCGHHGDLITGLAYSLNPRLGPISCTISTWAFLSQDSVSASIHHDSAAGDSPFLSGSELMSVDLVAGTYPQVWNAQPGTSPQVLNLEPRRLGRFPIARLGRCRGTDATGSWYAVTPNLDWFHVQCGIYLPWGGLPANYVGSLS